MAKDENDKISSGILGLGGVPVPKSPDDPVTEFDEESVAQRRARMESEETATRDESMKQGPGATGIDMGAGGTGTDIKPK